MLGTCKMVDLDFLESRNRELAEKLGLPTRRIVVTNESLSRVEFDPEVLQLSHKALASLDDEEATFMLAVTQLGRRDLQKLLPSGKLPSNPRLSILVPLVIPLVVLIALLVFDREHRGVTMLLVGMPLLLLSVMLVWSLGIRKPMTARRSFKKLKVWRRLGMVGRFEHPNYFREAVAITGNPVAAERYLRKSAKLMATEYGTLPFDDEAMEFAEYSYRRNVPPEYQVKTPY